jgi:hypothetical protein
MLRLTSSTMGGATQLLAVEATVRSSEREKKEG